MKKLLTVSAMALLAVSAFGQGQVNFVNISKVAGASFDGKVTDFATGLALSGTGARAALLGGPAGGTGWTIANGVATPGTLSILANATSGNTWSSFRTLGAAGYVAADSRILPNVGYGASASLQMVAWTGNATDWVSAVAAARADSTLKVGVSAVWNVVTTTTPIDTNFAPNTGLTPFSIAPLTIPEPSTMALAGLAGAALLIFRRRK